MADLARDAHDRRRELLAPVGFHDDLRIVGLHAVELFEEVDVEIGAAEFTVRDRLHADLFLHAHHLGDRAILHRAQRHRVDLLARELLACLEQIAGPKEAADVIGTRWNQRCHGSSWINYLKGILETWRNSTHMPAPSSAS